MMSQKSKRSIIYATEGELAWTGWQGTAPSIRKRPKNVDFFNYGSS